MSEPPKAGRGWPWTRLLALTGVAIVMSCLVVPGSMCRPAVDVNTFRPTKGATMDEIRSKYGRPSESFSNPDGSATWFYYTDKLGLGATMVGVNFDAAGRVESSFNH